MINYVRRLVLKHSDACNYNAVIIARDDDNIDHKRVDLDVSAKIL